MHKILFYNKFIICLYMFRALCAHHQEIKIVLYGIWYRHTLQVAARCTLTLLLKYACSTEETIQGHRIGQ